MSASNNKKCPYINIDQKISIIFDGKKYDAFKGDTIASALLRNNIRLIGRSFKYHRPRGIYTCGIEEPNGIVQILSEHNEPNTRATVKQIYDRMEIESQNRWPSLNFDLGAINKSQYSYLCSYLSLSCFIDATPRPAAFLINGS